MSNDVDRLRVNSNGGNSQMNRHHATVRSMLNSACIAATLLIFLCEAGFTQAFQNRSVAETCLAANENLSLGAPLPRTFARLRSGSPLKVVAVGSSSTVGLWVLNSTGTYPEVMRRELMRLRPNANSGRVGDTIQGNVARFDRDVLSVKPELVIWQLGTNDIAWGGRADGLKDVIIGGVRVLKASGADVILMDLQYAPMVLASSHHSFMQAIIADVARQEHVGLFPRFALMLHSVKAGLPSGALVSWDGLHNSAEGYDCIGRALARAIIRSAQ
jgi:acyl-CoA thioesterase I